MVSFSVTFGSNGGIRPELCGETVTLYHASRRGYVYRDGPFEGKRPTMRERAIALGQKNGHFRTLYPMTG